jgi:hypothetical protein
MKLSKLIIKLTRMMAKYGNVDTEVNYYEDAECKGDKLIASGEIVDVAYASMEVLEEDKKGNVYVKNPNKIVITIDTQMPV